LDTRRADFPVISAHADDAVVQLDGPVVTLVSQGRHGVFVDLCDGEPSDFDPPRGRVERARRTAGLLGVERRRTYQEWEAPEADRQRLP
jgi:LmbE family N-acetylglucosaminyl deacetylase